MRLIAKLSRRRLLLAALALLGLLGLVSRVEAADGMRGDRCVVGADQHIVEDFYFFCRVLEIRGTIDGDLLGIASEITITSGATVTGDLWIAGGKLNVSGTIGDDMHFAGITVVIEDGAFFPDERTDLTSLALSTELRPGSDLPGDLLVYGYQAIVSGRMGGDVDFSGEALVIDGTILGRIDATIGDARRGADLPDLPFVDVSFNDPGLWISDESRIDGDVAYKSAVRSVIPPGVVGGRIQFDQSLSQPDITQVEQADAAAQIIQDYILSTVRDILTLLLVGVAALRLVPEFVLQPALHVRRRTIPAVGWGLLTFMLSFPVAIVLLLVNLLLLGLLLVVHLTELSIVVGVAMLLLNLGLVGGFAFLLYFMGRVIISYVIGYLIFRYVLHLNEPAGLRRGVIILLLGIPFYTLITNAPLPALGITVELITALAGVGAIVIYIREVMIASEEMMPLAVTAPTAAADVMPEAQVTPLFDVSDEPRGLDNLPEGFTGFDDDW